MLWITPILSPLSPLPSKLRGQLQAPVYAVSPLSPLVPAQNNDSGSKTRKHHAKCALTLAAFPLACLGCVAGVVWKLPPRVGSYLGNAVTGRYEHGVGLFRGYA